MKSKNIRVLIVDDRLDDALRYASKLAGIRPELVGAVLEIEISNNAYFVAKRIMDASPKSLPWDIVISDVHMPIPDSEESPGVACDQATPETRERDGKSFTVHFWKPHSLISTDDWKHGGIHIAQCLEARGETGSGVSPKLVLVSRPLKGMNRARVLELVARNREWLDFLDKDPWEREPIGDAGHLMDEDMFVWALLDALGRIDRADWGRANWIPSTGDEDSDLVPSGKMRQAINKGRQLVQRKAPSLLICGEEGSGRTAVARILSNEACAVHGKMSLPPEDVDCSSISSDGDEFGKTIAACIERAGDGVLILDDVDRLAPPFQARILSLIKRRRFRARETDEELECRSCLIICITRPPESLNALAEERMFNLRLLDFFGDNKVELPPIREREEDFHALVLRAVRLSGHSEGIEDDAIQKLWERPWRRNVSELFSFVRSKCASACWRKLRAEDFVEDDLPKPALSSTEDDDGNGGFVNPLRNLNMLFHLTNTKSWVEFSSEDVPGDPVRLDKLSPAWAALFLRLAAERLEGGARSLGNTRFGPLELLEGSNNQWQRWITNDAIPDTIVQKGEGKPDDFVSARLALMDGRRDDIEKFPVCRRALDFLLTKRNGRYIYQLNSLTVTPSFDP